LQVLPRFKDGVAFGFSLGGISADSILHQLGIRNGDVVTQINNVPTTRLQELLALAPQLQSMASVQLQLVRNNQPITLSVSLQ
jgi:general secretion pathway protein C